MKLSDISIDVIFFKPYKNGDVDFQIFSVTKHADAKWIEIIVFNIEITIWWSNECEYD